MVVANAVAALADIRETSSQNLLMLTHQSLFKLLRALNECTEWGQVLMQSKKSRAPALSDVFLI